MSFMINMIGNINQSCEDLIARPFPFDIIHSLVFLPPLSLQQRHTFKLHVWVCLVR